MEKALYCDLDLCIGCGACVVACMDENDVDLACGELPNRRIHSIEEAKNASTADIHHVSVSCMHCEDSPCLIGCPTGAIYRHPVTDAVCVTRDLCIGCHSCALACPFGVPRYDSENKLTKCDLCSDRVVAGLSPACARVCPVSALSLKTANDVSNSKEGNYIGHLISSGSTTK